MDNVKEGPVEIDGATRLLNYIKCRPKILTILDLPHNIPLTYLIPNNHLKETSMKTFRILLLLVSLYLIGGTNVFGALGIPGPGCYPHGSTNYGKRDNGIYYTDCFPAAVAPGADPDDTIRLQSAVTTANGKLIFNEQIYYISKAIDLHSNLTIEGMSNAHSYSYYPRIQLTVDGTDATTGLPLSCFRIGSGVTKLAIRDLGFSYMQRNLPLPLPVPLPVATTAVGILATESGTAPNFTMASSQGFQFNNLQFTNFQRGIYILSRHSTSNWQFDDAQIEDTTFENSKYAIYTDCLNTGLQINNVMISSGAGQHGIWIQRGAYISMNMIVGNGHTTTPTSGIPDAGEFIHLDKYHGPTSIQNSNGEAYKAQLWIKGRGNSRMYPVELINNVLPACPTTDSEGPVFSVTVNFTNTVGINDAQVFSHGNYYPCVDSEERVARPEIRGYSDVVSTGDKFCRTGSAYCFNSASPFNPALRSEFALMTNTGVVRGDYSMDLNTTGVDWQKPILEVNSSWDVEPSTYNFKPMLALTSTRYHAGIPGTPDTYDRWSYTFSRSAYTGRLVIKGDEAAPNTGFQFKDGPVQLHSVTQDTLSTYSNTAYSISDSGSLLYCSNCTAGSTPCASGGSGALALKVGSAWHCK